MGVIGRRFGCFGALAAFIAVVAVGVFSTQTVLADPAYPNLSLNQYPALVVSSSSVTFGFFSFGDPTECTIDGGTYAPCSSPYITPSLADGAHTFAVHVIGSTSPQGLKTYAWTSYATPAFTGGGAVSGALHSTIAASGLQITGASDASLTVKLTVPDGALQLGVTTGLTFSGSQSGSSITFSGSRSHLNAALATLVYTPNTVGNEVIGAYIEGANGERYNTVDGRVFKVISTSSGLNWSDAKAAAEASTYGGTHGYLASILNVDQANFITERIPSGGTWLGGTDAAHEGDWRWTGGPEAGMAFWSGDFTGAAVGGAYTNWAGGMPDNYGGDENCLEAYSGTPITWNDQNCAQSRSNYVVEYGDGVTIPYVDVRQIAVTVTSASGAAGPTDTTSDIVPNFDYAAAVNTGAGGAVSDTTSGTTPTSSDTQKPQATSRSQSPSDPMLFVGAGLFLLLALLFFWRRLRLFH